MAIPYEGDKALGSWDFDGDCAPKEDGSDVHRWQSPSFTLGIFQVEAKAQGKGIKRGKVQLRVEGATANPGPAYALARKTCLELNAGADPGSYKKRLKAERN